MLDEEFGGGRMLDEEFGDWIGSGRFVMGGGSVLVASLCEVMGGGKVPVEVRGGGRVSLELELMSGAGRSSKLSVDEPPFPDSINGGGRELALLEGESFEMGGGKSILFLTGGF